MVMVIHVVVAATQSLHSRLSSCREWWKGSGLCEDDHLLFVRDVALHVALGVGRGGGRDV